MFAEYEMCCFCLIKIYVYLIKMTMNAIKSACGQKNLNLVDIQLEKQ